MTIREVYAYAGGNYDETVKRLGSEEIVNRFAERFLSDGSFRSLEKAFDEFVTDGHVTVLYQTVCYLGTL